jgi:MYXO-CTERM domain-containing protein
MPRGARVLRREPAAREEAMLRAMRSFASGCKIGLVAAGFVALLAHAGEARANGRYPAAGLVALDPADPHHIVVRATYGLLSTSDGGKTWSWMCEQAVGFSDNEDPMVAMTKNGTMLAGVFKGLSSSTDKGCGWSFAGGDLKDRYVVDLSVEKGAQDHAIAITSNGKGGGKFETKVFATADNGATWAQAGEALPEDFLGLSIDAAPSDPQRIYVTGRYGAPDYPGVLERSDDGGKTWTRLDIPGADDKHPPYLSAIDPSKPDKIYVRLDTADADVLVTSNDGGKTWTETFKATGPLLGFALSPDGKKVAVGGDKDGLWMADAESLQFTKVAELQVRCLTWAPDRLYACADEFKDKFHVGFSTNEGKTFTALEHLQQPCPLVCPAGSTMEEQCPIQWGVVSLTIGSKSCDSADGGSSSSSGSGGGTGGSGPAVTGCSCSFAGGGAASGALLFAAAALSAASRRRRRRRRAAR